MLIPERMQKIEALARQQCLKPLGVVVADIGMQKPFSDYQREEVLQLIQVVISAYQSALVTVGEEVLERERAYFTAQGRHHPLDGELTITN